MNLYHELTAAWPLALAALAAAAGLALLARTLPRPGRNRGWRELAAGEEGAAYSLSYVLTFPFFALLMCVIIEVALAMTVKLGTVYAAFAAARSYAVWLPSEPSSGGLVEAKARQAAAQAMAAFASGNPSHAAALGGGGGGDAQTFAQAYEKYAAGDSPAPSGYLENKRKFAEAATEVTLDSAPTSWDGDVAVTVRYQMPFHVPLVGKMLGGTRRGSTYFLQLQSQATLQIEGVKGKALGSSGNPLGIRYDPGEL